MSGATIPRRCTRSFSGESVLLLASAIRSIASNPIPHEDDAVITGLQQAVEKYLAYVIAGYSRSFVAGAIAGVTNGPSFFL